jgi:hypothetical protein
MDGLSLLLRLGTVKRRMRETVLFLAKFRTSLCHRPVSDFVEGSKPQSNRNISRMRA